ncbi:alpha-glucoside:hydrogen symporter [Kockovaella imperatae]|uniref:Alpha-glucoside:hydrogen symporter n=1 Tax=Kockovaella imperatae TaxID=4999 RepID=A0A1Y1U9W0_9TREE|nr:alpha-glucoside:hydrogen symporter [Kockovaella imperatae]ORX34802.1 alpha-glucoside:hydrogen symporter [Kockovaella imperatae]
MTSDNQAEQAEIPIDEKHSDIELSPPKHFDDADLTDAIYAEQAEKRMPLRDAFRAYPQAIFWSWAISACLIMEGYDTVLLGNLTALPVFREKFGHEIHPGKYQLEPQWQSAVGYGAPIGNFVGIFVASWFQDRYGYRRTIQACLLSLIGFIFVVFFAPNIKVLFVGEILCGMPWGAFASSAVSYASEVTPVPLRAYLTTYVNLCWVIGQLIASGVINGVKARTDQWAYRLPFALQWIWPIPIFILVTLAPESPWFLVRRGRLEEAERSVARLASRLENVQPSQIVAMMVRTNDHEIQVHEGVSYLDCFKGVDLRRTEIVCVTWACQILTGSAFANHASYFFEQTGLTTFQAVKMDLGMRGVSFISCILAWFVLTYVGRRKIILSGMTILCCILLLVGILSIPGQRHEGFRWAESALIVVWVFVWDLTLTPVAYAIVGETSSTRLRAKTVGLGRNTYNVIGIAAGILNTYQQNPTAWNWKGKAGFFWFGSCLLSLIWAYFRLPECKGRSYRELDILFERKVPARKFATTVIEAEEEH